MATSAGGDDEDRRLKGEKNNFIKNKTVNVCITYSESVFVASGIHPAMSMRHIVICGLLGSTTFFYLISRFLQKKKKFLNIK
jgi:hypothetical protein